MKNQKIVSYINPEIKVGDKVKLTDGSALQYKGERTLNFGLFIVNAYPELFGSPLLVKQLVFTVKEVGITDRITSHANFDKYVYLTDIIVEFNGIELYTASAMVKKIEPVEFNFGDKVLIVSGGAGAFGADNRIGILIDPQSVTYAIEQNYIRGGSYPEYSKNPVVRINDKEYWRLCNGYEVKLLSTFRERQLKSLHTVLSTQQFQLLSSWRLNTV